MTDVEFEVVLRVYRNGRRIGPIVSTLGDTVADAMYAAATDVASIIGPIAETGGAK